MKRPPLVAATQRALRDLGGVAGETILVGLSGGADSVALLDALWLLSEGAGFALVAAHLDHGLRPDAGDDAAFCRALCAGRGIPFRFGRVDVREQARLVGGGIEEASRIQRHGFLRAVKGEVGAMAIALAHTRDDQAETFLLRLLRGAGRTGLGGMRPREGDLWRPLLGVERRDVLAHLGRRDLAWREDPTNSDLAFLRNRVRHELMPYLEAHFNPRIRSALSTCATLLAEEADWLESQGEALRAKILHPAGKSIVVSRTALQSVPRPLARLILRGALRDVGGLRRVGFAHVEKILATAATRAPSGRRLALPGNREAVFSFDDIRIGPRHESTPEFAYPLPVPGRVPLPGGVTVTATPASGPEGAQGDAAVVEWPAGPLVVRTRLPGDRMRVGGREVSLKRVLREERVPVDLRSALPLVAVGRRVLWFPRHPFSVFRGTLEGGDAVISPSPRGLGRQDVPCAPARPEAKPRFVRLTIERP